MALVACPECGHNVSDKALACPSCGFPRGESGSGRGRWATVAGNVAGTYISAQMLASIIVGSIAMICFAAIMIAVIVS